MKLAVISDEVSQDLRVVLELAGEFGLDGIELRSVWNKSPHELTGEERRRIKRMVADYGLKVCSIASPFLKCDYGDESQYRHHLDILRRCIDLAHELGAPLIRGFTFWRNPPYPSWDEIVEKLREPIRLIEEGELLLGIENEPSTMATNARKVVEILKRLNHPRVKAVWDPGNDIFDPEKEVPYPDGYEIIKPWVAHIHIKDGVWDETRQCFEATPVGEGAVDYIGHFKALVKDGYDGYLSLETHYRPKVQLTEDIVRMPKGDQFSYLGDVATRECLPKLLSLLREAGVGCK